MLLIRDMTERDLRAVSTARVRGWQSAYAGLLPQATLDAMSVEEDLARRREIFAHGRGTAGGPADLVAERGGEVIGWACTGPCRDADAGPGDGELYALYVLPEHLSTGTGRALLAASLAHAADRGFTALRLWVLEGNARARRFYEIAGFAPDGGRDPNTVDGAPAPEVRYALRLSGAAPAGAVPLGP
ncbi:N-acetyltransferase family protein [Streptomyces sp. bgisy100]|uniref:GNAT family N-acetyltransferase n=1 Tax=Streptomyces sp. bgisy100 TaxID=3413783 RepID=UPI003D7500D7